MSKRTDLEALAAGVHFFQHDDIPTGGTPGNAEAGTWNINPDKIRDGLNLAGAFFEDTDTTVAGIVGKYDANHNPDGSHAPPVEWIPEANAPTFISASSFTLVGDRTPTYRTGGRIRLHQGSGGGTLVIVAITAATYASSTNTTTVVVRTATVLAPVQSSLVSIDRALVRESAPRVGGFDLLDNAIDRPEIVADRVIRNRMLGPNCVGRGEIADGEVLTNKLAAGAVTSPKLGAEAVLSANIGNGQVLGSHLATGAVGPTKLGTNAVQESHIADAQVRTRHIAPLNVTSDHMAPDAVRAYAIENGAVVETKIADGVVTPAKRSSERYQQPSGNSLVAAVAEQSGWSFFTVNGAGVGGTRFFEKAITFPVPFTQLLGVQVTILGVKVGSDPTHIGDSVGTRHTIGGGGVSTNGAANENLLIAHLKGGTLSLTGFTVVAGPNSTTAGIADGDRILFAWSARGRL